MIVPARHKIYHGWMFTDKKAKRIVVQLSKPMGGHVDTKFPDDEAGAKEAAAFTSIRLGTEAWQLEEQPLGALGYRIFTWKEA